MKKHANKGIRPEENTKADLFPLRYFNFALENVQKAEESLKVLDYDDGCQYLLVNLDMLITICKKYPTTASMGIYRLNIIKCGSAYRGQSAKYEFVYDKLHFGRYIAK